jgi:hypothetical protein
MESLSMVVFRSTRCALALTVVIFACGGTASQDDVLDASIPEIFPADIPEVDDAVLPPTTPIFVTLAGHLEPSDAYVECSVGFPKARQSLLEFAQAIQQTPVRVNLQIDRTFLEGVRDCETTVMRAETNGENVLEHLVQTFDFELDAHVEGGFEKEGENYADIRSLLGSLTDAVTETVGGWRWDSDAQFDALDQGQTGLLFPGFTWLPQVLTLGVSTMHHTGNFQTDDLTSGVWIPLGANDAFLKHNPAGRMVYVGPGQQHSNWSGKTTQCKYLDTADYVAALVTHLESGALPSDRIYTATLAVPQSVMLKKPKQAKLFAIVDRLVALAETGSVVFAHYTDVVEHWQDDYNAVSNIVPIDELDPATFTCR